jgi:WD40 repeat protein
MALVDSSRIEAISIWGEKGRLIGEVETIVGHVHMLRISDDDRLLAAGCEEGFHVWTLPELTPLIVARGDSVHSLAIHPDGHLLVTRSQRGQVELWSLHSNRLVARFDAPFEANRIDFSVDGKYLVIAKGDVGYRAWQVNGTPERCELAGHRGGVTGIVFSPDGRRLASVSKDRVVKLWDTESGRLVSKLEGHQREVQAVNFSPDGTILATGDWNSQLRLWDPETGRLLGQTFALAGQIWRIRFDPQGRYLIASGGSGVQAWEYEQTPDQVKLETFHWRQAVEVRDFAFLPGRLGYASIRHVKRSAAEIWGTEFGQPDKLLVKEAFFSRVYCLDVLPDGRLLYPQAPDKVGLFDLVRGEPANSLSLPLRDYYLSPDGHWLAGREIESTYMPTRFYRVATETEGFRLPHDAGANWCMAWSPSGQQLAVGYADGRLAIWRLESVRSQLAEFGIETPSLVCQAQSALHVADHGEYERAISAEREFLSDPDTLRRMTALAQNHYAGGWTHQAIALYDDALELASKKLGSRAPLTLEISNNFAWLLVVAPDSECRQPMRALELATMAVTEQPNNIAFVSTLATARYRNEDWDGTLAALQQATALKPEEADHPFIAFFSAMALHKLGKPEEARSQFDKAVARMNRDFAGNAEVARIHAEAAALLQIKDDQA